MVEFTPDEIEQLSQGQEVKKILPCLPHWLALPRQVSVGGGWLRVASVCPQRNKETGGYGVYFKLEF